MKEEASQVDDLRRYPIHRWRGPPSPMGKAKRRRLRRKKESQPRLAALGSPFQGKGLALFPVSSFRAKARNLFRSRSSRRCEDSGIFVSQPSPQGEGAPKGRIGQKRYEKRAGKIVSSTPFTRVPYPPLTRSPFPNGEGCETRIPLSPTHSLPRVGKVPRRGG